MKTLHILIGTLSFALGLPACDAQTTQDLTALNSLSVLLGGANYQSLGARNRGPVLKGERPCELKDLINRGGEKISANDIDTALLSNPKVLEAETFGEPDAVYGEVVHAAVVLRPGVKATESELKDYCRSLLSGFEVPEHIHIVEGFPVTAKGSIDKRALSAQFSLQIKA